MFLRTLACIRIRLFCRRARAHTHTHTHTHIHRHTNTNTHNMRQFIPCTNACRTQMSSLRLSRCLSAPPSRTLPLSHHCNSGKRVGEESRNSAGVNRLGPLLYDNVGRTFYAYQFPGATKIKESYNRLSHRHRSAPDPDTRGIKRRMEHPWTNVSTFTCRWMHKACTAARVTVCARLHTKISHAPGKLGCVES